MYKPIVFDAIHLVNASPFFSPFFRSLSTSFSSFTHSRAHSAEGLSTVEWQRTGESMQRQTERWRERAYAEPFKWNHAINLIKSSANHHHGKMHKSARRAHSHRQLYYLMDKRSLVFLWIKHQLRNYESKACTKRDRERRNKQKLWWWWKCKKRRENETDEDISGKFRDFNVTLMRNFFVFWLLLCISLSLPAAKWDENWKREKKGKWFDWIAMTAEFTTGIESTQKGFNCTSTEGFSHWNGFFRVFLHFLKNDLNATTFLNVCQATNDDDVANMCPMTIFISFRFELNTERFRIAFLSPHLWRNGFFCCQRRKMWKKMVIEYFC